MKHYLTVFLENEITGTLLEHKCEISIMPDYLILDIDSEEDYEMLQELIPIFIKRDEGIRRLCENVRDIGSGKDDILDKEL